MVPVVTWRVRDDELFQPLHTSATNLSRYDRSQRLAVIRSQRLAVHFVRQHHTLVRIHHPVEFDRCPVITVGLLSVSLLPLVMSMIHTSLSAPSMQTNLARRFGLAFLIKSDMATPVNKAVETPAGPHEKPLLL